MDAWVPSLVSLCVAFGPSVAAAARPSQSCRVVVALPGSTGSSSGRAYEADRDVDGDGAPDHVRIERSGGSGESSTAVSIRSSRYELELRVVSIVSFYGFFALTPVPDELLDDARRPLREAFEDLLFTKSCDGPDPSLEWLLDDRHRLRWYEGPPQMPTHYTILLRDAATLARFRREAKAQGGRLDARAVWVTYLGGNHARQREGAPEVEMPHELARQGGRVLLGTAHGVILATADRAHHAWIYVRAGGAEAPLPEHRRRALRAGRRPRALVSRAVRDAGGGAREPAERSSHRAQLRLPRRAGAPPSALPRPRAVARAPGRPPSVATERTAEHVHRGAAPRQREVATAIEPGARAGLDADLAVTAPVVEAPAVFDRGEQRAGGRRGCRPTRRRRRGARRGEAAPEGAAGGQT